MGQAVNRVGPSYGYNVNGPKSCLFVKQAVSEDAKRLFANIGVRITTVGTRLLGSAIGSEEFVRDFVQSKVEKWVGGMELSRIAQTEPHAAFSAYTHGLVSRWTYACRSLPNVSSLLEPVEDAVRTRLVPSLLGRSALNDDERDILALPARLGVWAL